MLSYLTRTSSADRLAEVMYHNAKCEGTLNERRKRVGKLRHDLDRLEAQVHRVDDLATNLQADAQVRAARVAAADEARGGTWCGRPASMLNAN